MEVEEKHRCTVHFKEGLRISVSPQQRFDEHMNQNKLTSESLATKKAAILQQEISKYSTET